MSITSFSFVFFVVIVVILYYTIPRKLQWLVLLAASILFYLSFSVIGLFILAGTSLFAYFSALQIQKVQDRQAEWMAENKQTADKETKKTKRKYYNKLKNRYVIFISVLCIGLLFLFKYYGPLAVNVNNVFHSHLWTAENILLPLGISFYSLQLIGYVVDVSRGITHAEKNPLKVLLYGSFFLSIMQGPFNRYNHLMPQICNENKPKLNFYKIKLAVLKITWGYIKKLCIADQLGTISAEAFSNYAQYSGLAILFGIFCFAVQLYADFSGYMDIIIGIGELLGIEIPMNFKQPFFSRNMSEFWQRWHITLGAWLKDYIFYPILKSNVFKDLGKWLTKRLGKEAGRKIPTYIGMLILWTLIGAWHGAGFNFVFGVGLLQFLYIFLGEITMPVTNKIKNKLGIKEKNIFWHIFQSIRCTLLIIFAWVFFNSKTFTDALRMLGRIFADKTFHLAFGSVFANATGGFGWTWAIYIFLCTVVLLLADILHEKGISIREKLESKPYPIRMLFYIACIFTLIVFGAYGTQYADNAFIYFQF